MKAFQIQWKREIPCRCGPQPGLLVRAFKGLFSNQYKTGMAMGNFPLHIKAGKSFIFLFVLFVCMVHLSFPVFSQSNTLVAKNGRVQFTSEAPLELIKASSDQLKGALDKSKSTFAFSVEISSFKGFNSDLQREHFHENYIETEKFPAASFSGKIIEAVDFSLNGTNEVRAKGFFTVHGVPKERIIKGTITVKNGTISIHSAFTVRLENHDIRVPKIVYEKIAEEINVEINIQFKP